MSVFRRCLLLVGSLLLARCGWHPLYAPGTGDVPSAARTGLAEISVALIPERTGQLLRLALQRRFEQFGESDIRKYDLAVTFSVASESIAVQQDSTSSRTRLIGTANWKLTAFDPQHTSLTSGSARDVDGYDIVDQEYFASDLEGDAVRRRIAETLADQIMRQLAVYFNGKAV